MSSQHCALLDIDNHHTVITCDQKFAEILRMKLTWKHDFGANGDEDSGDEDDEDDGD